MVNSKVGRPRKFNIGVDLDGVLADFTGSARRICQRLYGKPADDAIQTGWGFDSLGITEIQESGMWDYIRGTEHFWTKLHPMPNTDLLPKLVKAHNVVFITSRIRTGKISPRVQSAMWLHNEFGLREAKVVISHSKGEPALAHKLTHMIDDKPENLNNVALAVPSCAVVLVDATHNQHVNHLVRVANFNEFAEKILS